MEDVIKQPEMANKSPDSQFKDMLMTINEKYGDVIKAGNNMTENLSTEVNEFIDKLAHKA